MKWSDFTNSQIQLVIFYRDFNRPESNKAYGGAGLKVNALHTSKVLNEHGIDAKTQGIWTGWEIQSYLRDNIKTTHVVIEAPWLGLDGLIPLLNEFPRTQFIVRCHSQIGFLQVEPGAIQLIRQYTEVERSHPNFTLASNNPRFANFINKIYGRCNILPNLYHIGKPDLTPITSPTMFCVGSFGAVRIMKNHTTAAAAALIASRTLHRPLSFIINKNREEGPQAEHVLKSLKHMFHNVPNAQLITMPWLEWQDFRKLIHQMDICLQLSSSETFNIVTADAIAEQVPSVVGPAINWVPDAWQIRNVDDPQEAANKIVYILQHRHTQIAHGLRNLESYCENSLHCWKNFLHSA